ncbi:transposable element Tc3 transposase [Trichonephila clavipes]|nr:transposable element Tc3 transposase [Trichonephila clavipes]
MLEERVGSEELGENYNALPLILVGDFNVNFAAEDGPLLERKNRWNAGILMITKRSVSSSECEPVCDLKTVADVSKNGICYPTTSIRSTMRHKPLPRPISGNKCATSEGQYCQSIGSGAHSRHRNTNFAINSLKETQSCWPVCQSTNIFIPLTSVHKRARLNWSLKQEHWSVGEWANVMFSDESRFSLSSDSRRVTICRERGIRFATEKYNGKTSFSIKVSNGMGRHHDVRPQRPPFLWHGVCGCSKIQRRSS